MFGDGFQVMRDENAALFRCPGQHCGIGNALQTSVLRHDKIEMRNRTLQATQNSLIKVFVDEQRKQGLRRRARYYSAAVRRWRNRASKSLESWWASISPFVRAAACSAARK